MAETRIERVVAAGVGGLARLRGDRAVHGRGRLFTGTLTMSGPPTGAAALDRSGPLPVLVRLSRAAGLPNLLPDVYGLAIRLIDAYGPGRHQDLLLDSCPPPPADRFPLPRFGPAGRYGSLLRHRIAGRPVLIRATLRPPAGTLWLGAGGGATGTIRLAGPLDLDTDHQLRFDPASSGPGWEPPRRLRAVRGSSYRASRHEAPPPAGPDS